MNPLPNPLPLAGEGTNEKAEIFNEHDGMGGSYVINGAGERVLVQRTDYIAPAPVAPAPAPVAEPVSKRTKTAAVVDAVIDNKTNEVTA